MLDDHDRRALDDLERQFTRPFPTVLVLCAGLYICAPLAKLLFGWTGLEIVAASFVIAVAAVLMRRRRG
ncbi:DUF3040 domain-containing protein [Actinoplanes sp. NPDC049596]|uniref:DUF3040 domain-containing protein n=1 Tax=unclassified Actinoplanes TaxID=2626549 RepID=UPI0034370A55